MSKMPLGYRFRAWLLSYWFTSFEGGMVRDTWKAKFQQEERERIIKLLETEVMRLAETHGDTSWPEWVIALIKGEQQ